MLLPQVMLRSKNNLALTRYAASWLIFLMRPADSARRIWYAAWEASVVPMCSQTSLRFKSCFDWRIRSAISRQIFRRPIAVSGMAIVQLVATNLFRLLHAVPLQVSDVGLSEVL